MATLLIASSNVGKLREMQAILQNLPIDLILPASIGLELEVIEDGSTYAENAAKKALAYAKASGLVALADDSGLEVDALNGQPGLYSARYSPLLKASDADRRSYLLQNLRDKPRPWPAHFHCAVAIAVPGGEVSFSEGDVYGEIISEERGTDGFGYDPIFYMPELGLTMAQLPMQEKNQISHRARAVHAAEPLLKAVFGLR